MKKSTKKRHPKYDAKTRQEALEQLKSGKSVKATAQSMGINAVLLYQWRKRHRIASNGKGNEVKGLLKQIKQLKMERDIFQKSFEHFRPTQLSALYTFIADEMKTLFPIQKICKILGFTRSAYYAFEKGKTYQSKKKKIRQKARNHSPILQKSPQSRKVVR